VATLKEGLKAAQIQLKVLNMAPSTFAKCKTWFLQPWRVESEDPKHWTYVQPARLVPGEDGDVEVLRESLAEHMEGESGDCTHEEEDAEFSIEADLDQSGHDISKVVEEECRDAISQMLDHAEPSQPVLGISSTAMPKIEPVVEYMGQAIY